MIKPQKAQRHTALSHWKKDFKTLRADSLKNIDKKSIKRVSTGNENLLNMYKSYIGEPNGVKANLLFHVNYLDRSHELENNTNKRKKKR